MVSTLLSTALPNTSCALNSGTRVFSSSSVAGTLSLKQFSGAGSIAPRTASVIALPSSSSSEVSG